jgi:hypothetical protein
VQHVDPTIGWDDPDYTRPPPVDGWSGPRQWAVAYVVFTMVVAVLYLWSISVPGVRFTAWMIGFWGLVAAGVIWVVAVVVTVVRAVQGGSRRVPRSLVAVAVIGVVVVLCRLGDLPMRLLFEPSRAEFTEFAEQALQDADATAAAQGDGPGADPSAPDTELPDTVLPGPEWDALNPQVPERIGPFDLSGAQVLPQGVIIVERSGAMSDEAGFAYLPDGDTGSFTSWQLRSIGGDWYAFRSDG